MRLFRGFITILMVSLLCALSPGFAYLEESDSNAIDRLVADVELLEREGKYIEAISAAQEVLELEQKTYGSESLQVAGTLHWIGRLYEQMGSQADSIQFFRKSYDIYSTALSKDPDQIKDPHVLIDVGTLCVRFKDHSKAERYLSLALRIREEKLGPDHPDVGNVIAHLAYLYENMGDREKALSLYQRSLQIAEKAHGPDHPQVADYLWSLAGFYQETRQCSLKPCRF